MLQFIYYFFFSLTFFYGMYYLILGFAGFIKPKRFQIKPYLPQKKFAVIIAARNEGMVIGNLVRSLMNSNYPSDLFEVDVFVNNTTDDTAEQAKKAGANVYMVEKEVHTKGEVLNYAFDLLKPRKDIDGYIIFDADNVVHSDFIARMNDTLCTGYRVAEGNRDSKNMSDNWISGSYTLYYYMQNFFFNKSRMSLGSSSSINGTGFMIAKEKIDTEGFPVKTLTEDIEYTAICSLQDEPIAFVEGATTYDEQPRDFVSSWKQRRRWSVGCLQCCHEYNWKLLKHWLKTGNQASLDMMFNFSACIVQLICLCEFIALILFRIYNIPLYDVFSTIFSSGALFLLFSYVSGVIISLFVLGYNKRDFRRVISGIAMFTIFILSWVPINISCLFRKNTKWDEIKHTRSVSTNEINLEK